MTSTTRSLPRFVSDVREGCVLYFERWGLGTTVRMGCTCSTEAVHGTTTWPSFEAAFASGALRVFYPEWARNVEVPTPCREFAEQRFAAANRDVSVAPRAKATRIRIVGAAAREIAQHVATYVRPTASWSEVQVMRECKNGCKLHVRQRGAIRQYALHHSAAYGCQLGRDEATRMVPVSVAPKAKAPWVCSGDCGE